MCKKFKPEKLFLYLSFVIFYIFISCISVFSQTDEAYGSLLNKIKAIVNENRDHMDIGISALFIEKNILLSVNGSKKFPLASVFKVGVMLETLREVDSGLLDLDRKFTVHEYDKCIGSGSFKYLSNGAKVSLRDCLYKMITVSDNTATDIIWNNLKPASVYNLMRSMGLKNTQIYIASRPSYLISLGVGSEFGNKSPRMIADLWRKKSMDQKLASIKKIMSEFKDLTIEKFQKIEDISEEKGNYNDDVLVAEATDNISSPDDFLLFFRQVYSGNILKPESRKIFFDALLKQKYNTRIPALLPENTKVYHKTGTISGVVNDSGIISVNREKNIILVVFIKNISKGFEDKAARKTAEISKILYDYYQKN